MRLETFIGLRFLRSPRKDRVISVVTWLSVVGVMLGVTALIVTISVMNGFRHNLFVAVTGTRGHLVVRPGAGSLTPQDAAALAERLQRLPGVESTAPYLARQAFLSAEGRFRSVLLRGIEPEREAAVTEVRRFLRGPIDLELRTPEELATHRAVEADRILARLARPPEQGLRAGIVLGAPLARELGLLVGDELTLVSTVQRLTPLGPVPLMKRVQLVGTFETGISGTDEVLGYTHRRLAALLYRMGDTVDGLSVRMADPFSLAPEPFREALPGFRVRSWREDNRNVFQVMRLEKLGLFLVLTLIILVAFFNIISSLIMLVLEKRRGIAILKSMGASDGMMRRVFFLQGLWIGVLGTVSGLLLGLAACWALGTFDILRLPPGVYPLSTRLPVRIEWADLALITGSSFLICLLVTLYPATRAARERPVAALRFR